MHVVDQHTNTNAHHRGGYSSVQEIKDAREQHAHEALVAVVGVASHEEAVEVGIKVSLGHEALVAVAQMNVRHGRRRHHAYVCVMDQQALSHTHTLCLLVTSQSIAIIEPRRMMMWCAVVCMWQRQQANGRRRCGPSSSRTETNRKPATWNASLCSTHTLEQLSPSQSKHNQNTTIQASSSSS